MGKNKKKYLPGIIPKLATCFLILIGIAVIFSLYINKTSKNIPQNLITQKKLVQGHYTIVLQDDGFFPNKLVAQVGDTVTFVTKRSKPFWPASDFHPTHKLYSEFDPKKPIQTSDTWTLTLSKKGNWNYHDHLDPFNTGTIIVQEIRNLTLANKVLVPCRKGDEQKLECWAQEVRLLSRDKGPSVGLDRIAKLYNTQPTFVNHCHEVTHIVGEEAYLQLSHNKKIDFGNNTSFCSYGFYHGFTETLLNRGGEIKLAVKLCDQIKKETPTAGQGCYHGVGHGIMDKHIYFPVNNLVEVIKSSLDFCKNITKDASSLEACDSGVFNAVEIYFITFFDKTHYDKSDPYYICHQLNNKQHDYNCYWYMSDLLYEFWNHNYMKTRTALLKLYSDELEKKENIERAMNALSYALARDSKKDTIEFIVEGQEACNSITSEFRITCIQGYIMGLLATAKPEHEYEPIFAFCDTPLFSKEEKHSCYQQGFYNGLQFLYSKSKLQTLCGMIEKEHQNICSELQGIQL